jgi:ssDNA-binding Zn-finger/Zn-ribbon topoisomerase 1
MGRRQKTVGEGLIEGWACPKCGQTERFVIEATSRFEIQADGTEQCDGVEWSDANYVQCPECAWQGTVRDVEVPDAEWQ